MADERIQALLDERATVFAESNRNLELSRKEGRPLSSEEKEKDDKLDARLDEIEDELNRRKRAAARKTQEAIEKDMAEGLGRKTTPTNPATSITDPENSPLYSFDLRGETIAIDESHDLAERATPEYRKDFREYLQSKGRQIGSLQASDNAKGGYLAPAQTSLPLIKFLDDELVFRQMSSVFTVPTANSIGYPSWDTDPGDGDWTAEVPASDIAEDTNAATGRREFVPHLLTKLVKLSERLLRTSIVPIDQLIRQRLGYKLAVAQEKAFISGSGAQQPLGVFTASADGISTSRDVTAASGTALTDTDIPDLLYGLKPQYQRNATFLVSREFVKRARKLKDSNGQFVWQPGLSANVPDMLLGRPYLQSEFVPNTFTTGQYVAVCGDFSFYWIVDSLGVSVEVLDQLFRLKNQIGFLGAMESDGMPVLEEAFSRLKLA